jgi:5-methylcytosine-specific restriction endonuclease McrA
VAVLLLNASYEPLRVIPVRRAVGLLVAEKADTVAEGDGEIRSTSICFAMPAVVRLRYMVHVPFRNKRCQFSHCNRVASTVDHRVPRSRGGEHLWTNLVAACPACNARKGDRLLHELGWSLRRKPVAPRGVVVLLSAAGVSTVPEVWMDWLPEVA